MPGTQDAVFERIVCDYLQRGGARISWAFREHFTDPGPYTYTLQVGETGNNSADDWKDVGVPFNDAFFASDDEQRNYGVLQTPHYRLMMTTPRGVYLSQPAFAYGALSFRDWVLAREIVRKERLRAGKFVATEGLLLKRKRTGIIPDPKDIPNATKHFLTDEVIGGTNPHTGGQIYAGGYYPAIPFDVDLSLEQRTEEVDESGIGKVVDILQQGRCSPFPPLNREDIWVARASDQRYYVRAVSQGTAYRHVPLIMLYTLKLAPATDVAYDLPL